MPVTPQEFSLWARMTGNKYPNSVEEKVRLAPEVHNFSQNVGKQGALGVEQEPEPEQQSNLGSKLAKGALIAGGIAAGVAAARNPGVQDAVKSAASKVDDFVSNFTTPREVNVDTAEAVSDITKSAPRDVYSQSTIPNHQIEKYYSPVGLLRSGPQTQYAGGSTDVPPGPMSAEEFQHQRIKNELRDIAASNRARQERSDPGAGGRQLSIPARQTYNEQGGREQYVPGVNPVLASIRSTGSIDPITGKTNVPASLDSSERLETGELGVIPSPSVPLSAAPDQGNVFTYQALQQHAKNQLLDKKAADGTLTRAEEGAWLQNELDRSGTTPQKLFGHDSIEAYMDTYMPQEKEQSLSNKADAVISALGASDPEFGHIQHSPSELSESVAASGQNPVNTGMTGNPDNLIEKTSATNDPTTLTGQHDIQMAANNAVDQAENEAVASVLQIQADKASNSGIDNPKVDNFLKIQSAKRQNAAISDLDRAAYDMVAAGAESGEQISLERAQQILTDPKAELSFGEQRLFRGGDRVAVGQQTFVPGETQTGRMMDLRSGASGTESSVTDADRYNLENTAGLSKQTRKGAGTGRMRDQRDTPNIAGVLPTGGGRNARGMSAVGSDFLDVVTGEEQARNELSDLTSNVVRKELEARNQPEQNYSKFTDYSTGQTDEGRARDQQTWETATSSRRHDQMNSLFTAPTESGLLQLKTANRGNVKLSKEDLKTSLGPIATDVWNRAANHYAQAKGIQLPDPSSPDYFNAANNVIYGGKDSMSNVKDIGITFNSELQKAGLDLQNQDPFAVHTLYSIVRGGAGGELSLRSFNTAAKRARSQGLLERNPNAPIPHGLSGGERMIATGASQLSPPRTEGRPQGRQINFNEYWNVGPFADADRYARGVERRRFS